MLEGLDMSMSEYLKKFVLPILLFGFLFSFFLPILFPEIFGTGMIKYLMYSIPVFCLFVVVSYPKILLDRRRREIDQNIHYFITHMGVLATSDLSLIGIFDLLRKREEEYGALAREVEKIFILVDTWHLSIAEASRFVGRMER
ncbi:MAG: hypothetical protein ACXQTD_04540 [Candidatus Syntropharchaeia archaeon]